MPGRLIMADYDRPAPSADEAAEHLRALAHATRHFQDPGETHWVLGDLAVPGQDVGDTRGGSLT